MQTDRRSIRDPADTHGSDYKVYCAQGTNETSSKCSVPQVMHEDRWLVADLRAKAISKNLLLVKPFVPSASCTCCLEI